METRKKGAAWYRVSTGRQDERAQVPDVEAFAAHHRYDLVASFELNDISASKGEQKAVLKLALAAAHRGEFEVLVVWALDRLSREGIEDMLRTVRKFREAGCAVVSVQEPWCNDAGETQDLLLSITAWVAAFESRRKGERMRIWHANRKAQGLHTGRTAGAEDKKPRKKSGYYVAWEDGGKRRAAEDRKEVPV